MALPSYNYTIPKRRIHSTAELEVCLTQGNVAIDWGNGGFSLYLQNRLIHLVGLDIDLNKTKPTVHSSNFPVNEGWM